MTCVRICVAYSFKRVKKLATAFSVAVFFVTMVGIFKLYSYKHKSMIIKASDESEYRPGVFLENRQPDKNKSYCKFNYGLPDELKWDGVIIDTPPEQGAKSPCRVIYNAIEGTAYNLSSKYNAVTYATQATPEYIYYIVEIARYWEGPISLAVFVPDYDLDIAMQYLKQLCHCYAEMSKVSVHLFYPKRTPPKFTRHNLTEATIALNVSNEQDLKRKISNYLNLDKSNRSQYIQNAVKKKIKRMMVKTMKFEVAPRLHFVDCSGMTIEKGYYPTFRKDNNMLYPVNVGRNVARNATFTNYFIVSDIEMIPSRGLATKFVKMIRNLMGDKRRNAGYVYSKTVFVVPLFEIEKGEEIPLDKQTLLSLLENNRAQYFHHKKCSHCQRFPGIQSWLSRRDKNELVPMLVSAREYPYHRWEPIYFGTQKDPYYSELLTWEGLQDRMIQMLELCLLRYRMVILDGGFMVHAASSAKPLYSRAIHQNQVKYIEISQKLENSYKPRRQCRMKG